MYGFKVNDTVTFSFKGKETYGIIQKIGKKNAKIWVEDLYEDKTIPIDRLTFVPPVILTQTQIRRLCRYEVKMSELRQGQPDEWKIACDLIGVSRSRAKEIQRLVEGAMK